MNPYDVYALLDLGNSRLKLGLYQARTGQRESQPLAIPYTQLDDAVTWLQQQRLTPQMALGVSVTRPQNVDKVTRLLHTAFGIDIQWLTPSEQAAGVFNSYQHVKQLGADRWAAILGLAHLHQPAHKPLLLANFGTATTIDTVLPLRLSSHAPRVCKATTNIQWVFEGGMILPGVSLMRTILNQGTAQLPLAAGQVVPFPTNTQDAIHTGIIAAQAGAVLRQWDLLAHQFPEHPPLLYGTGGNWAFVQQELEVQLAQRQGAKALPAHGCSTLHAPALTGLQSLLASGTQTHDIFSRRPR